MEQVDAEIERGPPSCTAPVDRQRAADHPADHRQLETDYQRLLERIRGQTRYLEKQQIRGPEREWP